MGFLKNHRELIENLVAEIRKLTSGFAKLEFEFVISKNVTTVLSERFMQMESQYGPMLNDHGKGAWKL